MVDSEVSATMQYAQVRTNLNKLGGYLKEHGCEKRAQQALLVNSVRESYCNPSVLEGAINPGPPMALNGGGPGGGLWQWTPVIVKLGDWDDQIEALFSNRGGKWGINRAWLNAAGLQDPTPKIMTPEDFYKNKYDYSAGNLTRAFIAYFEKPAYSAGANRFATADEDAQAVEKYAEGGAGGNNNSSPGNTDKPEDNPGMGKAFQDLANKVIKDIETALNDHAWQMSDRNFYKSKIIIMERTYKNRYKITLNNTFIDNYKKDLFNTKPPKPYHGDPDNDNKPSGGGNMEDIYNWCKRNKGKSYDMDGLYGAQCVDMIAAINKYVVGGVLNTGGDYAKNIYNNPVPSGWHKVAGDPLNDSKSAEIWNKLPNGAIVWFTNSGAGHVGVKAGNWANHLGQNIGTDGSGGPIREQNLATWIQNGGAGFLGAWVKD